MHVRQDGHNCCHNPPDSKQRETELKKQEKFQVLVYDIESKVVDEDETGIYLKVFADNIFGFRGVREP